MVFNYSKYCLSPQYLTKEGMWKIFSAELMVGELILHHLLVFNRIIVCTLTLSISFSQLFSIQPDT